MPDAAKAASSGANTVNGPVPLKVACKFAFNTAVSRVVKFAPETTTSVIVLVAGTSSSSSFSQLNNNTGILINNSIDG